MPFLNLQGKKTGGFQTCYDDGNESIGGLISGWLVGCCGLVVVWPLRFLCQHLVF